MAKAAPRRLFGDANDAMMALFERLAPATVDLGGAPELTRDELKAQAKSFAANHETLNRAKDAAVVCAEDTALNANPLAVICTPDAARVRIAVQMAFGAMVNALLHDPGPLRLDDDAFGPGVMAALTPYLTEIRETGAAWP